MGRMLLVLFVCAGVAGMGLFAGGEHRRAVAKRKRRHVRLPAGYFPPDMPRYPEVIELPAGPSTLLGGSKSRMSFFTTKDDPLAVARFYKRFWQSRKLWVRDDVTHVGGAVSAFDERRNRMYQVLLIVRRGRTVAFPSMTEAPLRVLQTHRVAPPLPLMAESRVLMAMESEDKPARARIVLSLNDGGLEGNIKHYSAAAQAKGFALQRPKEHAAHAALEKKRQERLGPQTRVLLFVKGNGEEITVNLTALSKKRVRAHITWVRR
ncbi:MAG: hypothetical protein KC503_09640 [Myxococcales bacterium]|nr:hypothetical protein [Myxococcales bacterium]